MGLRCREELVRVRGSWKALLMSHPDPDVHVAEAEEEINTLGEASTHAAHARRIRGGMAHASMRDCKARDRMRLLAGFLPRL